LYIQNKTYQTEEGKFDPFIQTQVPGSPSPIVEEPAFSLDIIPQEYPFYGKGDYRHPAYEIQSENGSTVTELLYDSHIIKKGKMKLEGLPATYVENEEEAETVEIKMIDKIMDLAVILSYTVYEELDVITRSVRFENNGAANISILRALSMTVDFNTADYDMMTLCGAWARERHVEINSLRSGTQSVESRRGLSSHQQHPFIALLQKGATEDYGEVFGFSLAYSGNFIGLAEVDQFTNTRVSLGINPFDFQWLLEPKQSFQTPEVVMVYSDRGIGEMSRTYHKLYRTRLCRGVYRDQVRPILINNWEATYFDFNEEKLLKMAKEAKDIGIELFVLDDGWFGKRDDDTTSLGDWFVDESKLPNGLASLGEKINQVGLKFGLWFEPEMVSPNSDLYRQHPDWCLQVPNRELCQGRNQYVLDFSRKDVCDTIIKMIKDVLNSAPISYVKWDMNRSMTEIGSVQLSRERQRETAHRYILGLYYVLEELTKSFPNILFESCASGGGRFDPGMLYYMPQTWTSDDTDAIERLKIQYGTSIIYPISSMDSNVSAVPNHQVYRTTSLKMRGDVAAAGLFGYTLDLATLTEKEKEYAKQQIENYKEIRKLIQFGEFYRLYSPFEGNETAWMFVSEDKKEAYVMYYRILAQPNPNPRAGRLRLQGLDPTKKYEERYTKQVYGGDFLMNAGVNIPGLKGDFQSVVWYLKEK
jgi:alpha-galactosidase